MIKLLLPLFFAVACMAQPLSIRDTGLLGRVTPSGGGVDLTTGLAGYWKLNEASGARNDSSGNGNHLTDNNAVGSGAGQLGNAAQFAAVNSYLSLAGSAQMRMGSAFTIFLWFQANDQEVGGILLDKNFTGCSIGTTGLGAVKMSFRGGANVVDTGNGVVQTGTWHFVMAKVTASTLYIQVDGGSVFSSVNSQSFSSSDGALEIGRYPFGSYFDGAIDSVRWYDADIGSDVADALWNSGAGTEP